MCVCVHKITSKKGILNLAGGCTAEGVQKVKIQHVSRKNGGLIPAPCEPKGKFNQTSSEVWLGPQVFPLDFTYVAPNIYTFAVSKWWGLYLQRELPMGVKISRGLSVCSTYGLRLCVYIPAPMKCLEEKFLRLRGQGGEEKTSSFTALFQHEALLSSSSPPPDLLSPGYINGFFSAPLLRCAPHFSDRLNQFKDKFDGVTLLFQTAWITSALLFSLNTNVQRWLLQGRKQFSKLFPKIRYFNPSVLTRCIKLDLQEKMLLVCPSASQTLLFLEDSSEQIPPTT